MWKTTIVGSRSLAEMDQKKGLADSDQKGPPEHVQRQMLVEEMLTAGRRSVRGANANVDEKQTTAVSSASHLTTSQIAELAKWKTIQRRQNEDHILARCLALKEQRREIENENRDRELAEQLDREEKQRLAEEKKQLEEKAERDQNFAESLQLEERMEEEQREEMDRKMAESLALEDQKQRTDQQKQKELDELLCIHQQAEELDMTTELEMLRLPNPQMNARKSLQRLVDDGRLHVSEQSTADESVVTEQVEPEDHLEREQDNEQATPDAEDSSNSDPSNQESATSKPGIDLRPNPGNREAPVGCAETGTGFTPDPSQIKSHEDVPESWQATTNWLPNECTIRFRPIDLAWQRLKCAELMLSEMTAAVCHTTPRVGSAPSDIVVVQADGNCLFRCLSIVITGEASHHKVIRGLVVDHMEDVAEILTCYLPPNVHSVAEYVRRTRMRHAGKWGTDVEIYAAVHLLKTDITVYTCHGDRWEWCTYSLRDLEPTLTSHEQSIYLQNTQEIHFDVVVEVA